MLSYKKTNIVRTQKMGDKYLLTANAGTFLFLTPKEYISFKANKLTEDLYQKLEENDIIITPQNELRIVERYKKKNSFLTQGTSLHIIVVTLRCNMGCTYCQASRRDPRLKEYDMNKETAKKTVDFIFQSPSPMITIEFQGGEPTLNWDVVKYIIEYAEEKNKKHQKNMHFNFVSNFTLLTDEKLDYLVKHKAGLCTSLDGPELVHDKNRPYLGGKGTHKDLIEKIKKVNNKKSSDKEFKIDPNGLPTITKHSIPYPKEIVDEYVKYKFKRIWFRPYQPLGYAQKEIGTIGFKAEEFIEFYKTALDYIVLEKKPIIERWAQIILKKIYDEYDPNFLDLRSPCGAAIGQMAYNYDGSIYSCDEGRMVSDIFKIGDVNQTYKEVINSNETCNLVASSVNDILLCDNCVFKPYCGVCPVVNYATQGNLIPKLAEDERCKILKGIFGYIFEKIENPDYIETFNKWRT